MFSRLGFLTRLLRFARNDDAEPVIASEAKQSSQKFKHVISTRVQYKSLETMYIPLL